MKNFGEKWIQGELPNSSGKYVIYNIGTLKSMSVLIILDTLL